MKCPHWPPWHPTMPPPYPHPLHLLLLSSKPYHSSYSGSADLRHSLFSLVWLTWPVTSALCRFRGVSLTWCVCERSRIVARLVIMATLALFLRTFLYVNHIAFAKIDIVKSIFFYYWCRSRIKSRMSNNQKLNWLKELNIKEQKYRTSSKKVLFVQ